MESGHVRRPQAARSTGRPQYHGGSRGMRDEEMRRGLEQDGEREDGGEREESWHNQGDTDVPML